MIPSPGISHPRVELVYDADCPNVDAARRALSRALAETGLVREWAERRQDEAVDPIPSPTVLVDGEEVGGSARGAACRVYTTSDGRMVGAPPVDVLVDALEAALARRRRSR